MAGCFPLFSGKVQIVSRTLSGLFLVGALILIGWERGKGQIGKIPGPSPRKSGKSRKNRESPKKDKKGQKRTKKEGQVQIGKPPRLKHPRLAALDFCDPDHDHNYNRAIRCTGWVQANRGVACVCEKMAHFVLLCIPISAILRPGTDMLKTLRSLVNWAAHMNRHYLAMSQVSGIAKPMVCLRVAFRENKNEERSQLQQGAECCISGNHGKPQKWRKPRESGVQTTGSPNNGFGNAWR